MPDSPLDERQADRLRLERLVRGVGDLARSLHGKVEATYKEDGSPVTEADFALQEALVDALAVEFPEDGVQSEEGTCRPPAGGGVWYVDPIDGTGAFLQGLAHWGPSLCRVDAEGELDVGVFYEPLLDRVFSAARGGGAWRNGVQLPRIVEGGLRRDDVLFVPSRIHRRPGLPWPGKLRALGSTAAHLALLGAGHGRAAIVARWSMWDVGCGVLMNREVGHVLRGLDGRSFRPAVGSEGLPFAVGGPKALDILDTEGWASTQMPLSRT